MGRLHDATGRRDQAGNRLLFYDQDAALLLLDCFRPLLTRLRALQQATERDMVLQRLSVRRTSGDHSARPAAASILRCGTTTPRNRRPAAAPSRCPGTQRP